ncbi:MAG: hypothetical protein P9L94_02565 [Candidatus Hinthialibacter antarcticus]|nr:hypothetical protein [Candidatus Hinthialibacter antarcticus]
MSEIYELLPGYQKLAQQCSAVGVELEPEPGGLVLYHGQPHRIIGEDAGALLIVATPVLPPIDQNTITTVPGWMNDPLCVYMPGVACLIDSVRSISSMFPTITPGVKSTREVWQVKHPDIEPVVANSLEESLLQAVIQILENKIANP